RTSIIGSSLSGRSLPPLVALSSCCVTCSHSRKLVKSDGLTIGWPSRNCILPFYSKGHFRDGLRQLSVGVWDGENKNKRLPLCVANQPVTQIAPLSGGLPENSPQCQRASRSRAVRGAHLAGVTARSVSLASKCATVDARHHGAGSDGSRHPSG